MKAKKLREASEAVKDRWVEIIPSKDGKLFSQRQDGWLKMHEVFLSMKCFSPEFQKSRNDNATTG